MRKRIRKFDVSPSAWLCEPLERRCLLSATLNTLATFMVYGTYPKAPLVADSSGNLYGTTEDIGPYGEPYGSGTLFEITAGNHHLIELVEFDRKGNSPGTSGGVIADSSGNLFGVTNVGGTNYDGRIYEYSLATHKYITLINFGGSTGLSYPQYGLVMDHDGNLYGTNGGVIFELSAATHSITTLATFNETIGIGVNALMLGNDGNIYGTTAIGGANGDGTIFELSLIGNTFSTMVNFDGTDGNSASGPLIADSAGNLYGVTEEGGTNNLGTAFKVSATDHSLTTLANFDGENNGSYPIGGLTIDSNGNLYGTTESGGAHGDGTIFEISAVDQTLMTLATFNGSNGANPLAGLLLDNHGNLYGTTWRGGANGEGTAFELSAANHTLTTIATFGGNSGDTPEGTLTSDGKGGLLGTTDYGGTNSFGSIFEISPGNDVPITLASFNGTNGQEPIGGLVTDNNGNFFGTTYSGGGNNDGTIFEYSTATDTLTTLVNFNGDNGKSPMAGLTIGSDGNLYGTTAAGGANDDGTVFEFSAIDHRLTTLVSFDGSNGQGPYASVIADSSGNLYGTTAWGGANNDGTVFELSAADHTLSTLASFNYTDGSNPFCSLLFDNSGDLFGTASGGGANGDGTVFEISTADHTLSTLASFNGANGQTPYAGLVADGYGNLYGTTVDGGANNDGTVFELSAADNSLTTLISFNGDNGANPYAPLITDENGNLYGTAESGGYGNGTVFEVTGAIPYAGVANRQLSINGRLAAGIINLSQADGTITLSSPAGDESFDAGSINSILISGADGSVTLKINTPVSVPLAFNGTLAALSLGPNAAATLASGVGTLTVNSLSVGTGATLDIGNGDLVVNYTGASPAANIAAMIAPGYNNGQWDGAGIISSAAAADSSHTTGVGYFDNGSTIEIGRTWYGDANVSGSIDADDFALMMLGQMQHGARWQDGDFSFHNEVNADDWMKFVYGLAASRGQQLPGDASTAALLRDSSSNADTGHPLANRTSAAPFARIPIRLDDDLSDLLVSPRIIF